jgi:hypothetical protein
MIESRFHTAGVLSGFLPVSATLVSLINPHLLSRFQQSEDGAADHRNVMVNP